MRDGSCAKQLLHLHRQRLPEHVQSAPLSSHVVLMAWLLNNGEVSKLRLLMCKSDSRNLRTCMGLSSFTGMDKHECTSFA